MMTPLQLQRRRGVSLVEVMIAFFVLAVGVVSVVSLFPVGIAHVHQAVLDTRTTILGMNADATIKMHEWWDDPYLIRPPIQGVQGAAAPFNQPDPLPAASGGLGGDPRGISPGNGFVGTQPASSYVQGVISVPYNNVYAQVLRADGTACAGASGSRFRQGVDPNNSDYLGFPVYVDPVLANSPEFQHDPNTGAGAIRYKRVAIEADLTVGGTVYRTMAPFAGALNDLVIMSPSGAQFQPSASGTVSQPIYPSRRDAYLRNMFFSTDELQFEENAFTIPYQPNRLNSTTMGGAWRYAQSANTTNGNMDPPTSNESTAARNDNYHYSFAVKNRYLRDYVATPANPFGAVLPTSAKPDVQVLVFNQRAIVRGYHLVRACFYANSSVVTLCWDPAIVTEAPAIRRGSWIMEATLSPAFKDNTHGPGDTPPGPAPQNAAAAGTTKYRHAVEFHQVSSMQEPQIDQASGQMVQVVNLEQPVVNYPISHSLGDARALPDAYQANTFDGTARTIVVNDPGPTTVWVPVIVWHGLQEVFSLGK